MRMTADRHALIAALEFADKQADEIKFLVDAREEMFRENRQLRRQLRDVQKAANGSMDHPVTGCRPSSGGVMLDERFHAMCEAPAPSSGGCATTCDIKKATSRG